MGNFYKRKGYALAGAMMFLLLVMIMWMGVTRQLGTNMRVEKHLQSQKDYYYGSVRALAWGLTLCETGRPPMSFMQFTKSYWVLVGEDGLQKYVITYTRIAPYLDGHYHQVYNYTVVARPYITGSDSSVQKLTLTHF